MGKDNRNIVTLCAAAALIVLIASPPTMSFAAQPGERVYVEKCASCHGKAGEGVRGEYSKPLIGDKSVAQLARYITKWMPEEKPEECVGEEAEAVARYVYDAFYSPIAQARNAPPRIELSRLTVTQHRNAIADLVATFRKPPQMSDQRGLRAEYFKGRSLDEGRLVDRVDPVADARFTPKHELAEKWDPKGFSVRWTGSLLPPETGEYEIVVRSDQAVRLWINTDEAEGGGERNEFAETMRPLVDGWVKSGNQEEFRAKMFLLAGRAYPVVFEFSSHTQGVGDKRQHKRDADKTSYASLRWKLPHRVEEVIPQRCLSPTKAREVFVVDTPFPPDDRSVGYERGASVSKAWTDATTGAAIETADYVVEHLDQLAHTKHDDPKRADKARRLCETLVARAFRRPLTDAERNLYVERQLKDAPDLDTGVKRVVMLALTSPRFLYRDLSEHDADPYETAERLAFALWDALPDQTLLDAASKDELKTPEQVAWHARRMVRDPRAEAKMRQFMHYWLDIEHVPDLSKDDAHFSGFDNAVASDLRTSLDLFLDEVMSSDAADFRQLLSSDAMYVNGRIAQYYGFDLPADAPFTKVTTEAPKRTGVLTHPYVLARFAYRDSTSPIHRGVFLVRSVLGRALRPPPEAVAPTPVDLHPDLTTRQRVEKQTEPRECQSCHSMINSLGFTLEHFDAVGRFRESERGKPIDASGAYELPSGKMAEFRNAQDLAAFLIDSHQAHGAFVVQLFHHLAKQPIRAYGHEKVDELRKAFESEGFNIRKLMVDAAVTVALAEPDVAASQSP